MRALLLLCLVATTATADPQLDQVLTIPNLVGDASATKEDVLLKAVDAATGDDKADAYLALAEHYARQHRVDAKAKAALHKAVKTLGAVVDNDAFRNYPHRDVALFEYGYLLWTGGSMTEARSAFDNLLKNYPQSLYVPETHLVVGESYLAANQPADAEQRYKQVLKFPKSAVYWFAMYRMGDLDIAAQRYQEALETYFQVSRGSQNDELGRAARRGFVRAYAEIGKPDKAQMAFQRVSTTDELPMLRQLAELYVQQNKLDNAAVVYASLLRKSHDAADIAAVGKLAKASKDEQLLALYISANPPDLADAQLALADARWADAASHDDAGAWDVAAATYDEVVTLGKLDRKRLVEAARAAAIARRNAIEHTPTHDLTRIARLTVSLDAFARLVKPADPDLVELRVFLALALADPPGEIPILADVVAQHRDHDASGRAAVRLIDDYVHENRLEDLHALVAELRRDRPFLAKHPEVSQALDHVELR